jgi:hypothetical protein
MTLHDVCELYVVGALFSHDLVLCSLVGNFYEKCFIFIMAISFAYMSPCILLAMLVLKL